MDRADAEATEPASERRRQAARRLVDASRPLAEAAAAMAHRFGEGGVLRPVGTGVSSIDASHVAVEFLHPVITGKRALAASVLGADARFVRPGSIVLGLRLDDDPAVRGVLPRARSAGCLTVDLGTDTDAGAEHTVPVAGADRLVARELQVTTYHLLWELVHEHLDGGAATDDAAPDDLADLYPFLYERTPDADAAMVELLVDMTGPKLDEVTDLRLLVLDRHADALARSANAIRACRRAGGTVWTFGNGGSSTDAQALAHLLSSDAWPGDPVDARALTDDAATVTALSNDVGFGVVFARMLRSLARPGDVAVGLSTSGGSVNVLAGLEAATELGLATVGFAGYDGGTMADLDVLDELLVVPSSSVHRIQEAQTTLAHVLVELARRS